MSGFEDAVGHSRMHAAGACALPKQTTATGGMTGGQMPAPADNGGSNVSTSVVDMGIADTRHFATGPAHNAPKTKG